MRAKWLLGAAALVLAPAAASASCPALPNQLANGQTADAVPLMADLNQLRDCLNGQVGSISAPSVSITNGAAGTVTIRNPSAASSYDFNLPPDPGSSGQVLVSGGPGVATHWSASPAGAKAPIMDGYPVLRPTALSLTWGNQGTSTLVDHVNGPLTFVPQALSYPDQTRGVYKSAPAAPFALTVKLDCFSNAGGNSFCGAFVMDAAGKIVTIGAASSNTLINEYKVVSFGSLSQLSPSASVSFRPTWLRIYDDGAVFSYYASSNGSDWDLLFTDTHSSTGVGTVTQAGILAENYSSKPSYIGIWSLEVVAGTGTNSSWQ